MKTIQLIALLFFLSSLVGCGPRLESTSGTENDTNNSAKNQHVATIQIMNQTVEASCGECQFGMEGSGCDLAVRIEGKAYYVDGAMLDDHGDAHGDDGMCNCIRQAKVSGELKGGRFVSTSFEVMPFDKE